MSAGSWLYLICCKMSSLVRSDARRNTVMATKIFCQHMHKSFGRSTADKKSKSISRVSMSVRSKSYPLYVVVAHWFSQRVVLHGGLSVGLCCWRLGFRKWTVHEVELMHHLCHCCLGHFDLWGLWARTEMPGKEANWHPENGSFPLPDYENPSRLRLLLSDHWDADLHILWPFREVQPHTSSPECLVTSF